MNRLRLWLTAGIFILLVMIPIGAGAGPIVPDYDPPATGNQNGDGDETQLVRVYFDDLEMAHKIAIWLEPLEAQYEKGYLVLEVTSEEYDLLLKAGLRVETDAERMKQLALQRQIQSLNPSTRTISGFSCYRTVEETFQTAQDIATNFPNLATWTDQGNSWARTAGLGGYDMNVLRLTNSAIPGPKPKIFITSAIHAREYTTAELMTRFAEDLVTGYGTDADATWVLDYHEIHLMLQTNPDGRKQAEAGILWRKNTNQNYCSPTSSNRGADLNRNFPFNWSCCGGSSGNQCSETYRGSGPASEPETQAVRDYILAQFPDQRGPNENDPAPLDATGLYLDIHSSGRLLLWPWGHTSTPAPNSTQLQTLGRKFAYFNGHTPEQSIGLYPTDGTTTSFAYGELGLAAYTFELGTEFFESCGYFTNTLLPDNMPALKYAIKVPRTPYMTPAGPDTTSPFLFAGSSPPGVPAGTLVDLGATIDDTRFNNSNGTEPTQNIAAAEYYIDTPPWVTSPTPVAIPMGASDGNFNSSIETVEATIDTTGLSEGQHIIFIRGQDANGNWGAFSAVFLYIAEGGTPPVTLFEADFNADTDGFSYVDDAFRSTAQPTYADGTRLPTGGFGGSGGLQVVVGGVDDADILNMSGGWQTTLNFSQSADNVNLSFRYNLTQSSEYESDEFSQALVSVDGTLHGQPPNDYVAQITGNGNGGSPDSTGWQLFQVNLGTLPAGNHTIAIGGFNNKKTLANESAEVLIDDVLLTGVTGGPPVNTPPSVDAGSDQIVTFPNDAALDGTVTDDGLPNPPGTVTTTWSQVSGPGSVTFGNAGLVDTTASFSEAGTYVLRLTADDSEFAPNDDVTITVNTGNPSLIFEDDFETDQGWTPNPAGTDTATTGMWERGNPEDTNSSGPKQLGTTVSGSFDLVTGAVAGSSVGVNDIDNGVTSIRSPNISLPPGESLTLSFSYYMAHTSNSSSADFFRVTVVGSTSTTVLEELGAANDDDGVWDSFSTSLDAFAGQTVYLLIEAADAAGGSIVEAAVDDVSIVVTPPSTAILEADFDSGTDGFSYADDTFRSTNQPAYATGTRLPTGGFSGGGLQVVVGGIDTSSVLNMSGGWQTSFNLGEPTDITVAFRYNLTQSSEYESDEFSQALISVDGTLYGQSPNDYVAQITGNGNGGSAQSTGWQLFTVNIGMLSSGNHTLTLGGFNNKKTYSNESTEVLIDDVLVTGVAGEIETTIELNQGDPVIIYLPLLVKDSGP